jgi:putative acetyltransferase
MTRQLAPLPVTVRNLEGPETEALHGIFLRAVRDGAAGYYDETQRAAWSGRAHEPPAWAERLGGQITVVAWAGDQPQGFMTLGHDGHLDLAFVRPEAMGRGVAAALHDRLIHIARENGLTRLDTEASHLARRFFLRQGWVELAEQQVEIRGVKLTNFRMEKRL